MTVYDALFLIDKEWNFFYKKKLNQKNNFHPLVEFEA
jgi:hypothetical protein